LFALPSDALKNSFLQKPIGPGCILATPVSWISSKLQVLIGASPGQPPFFWNFTLAPASFSTEP